MLYLEQILVKVGHTDGSIHKRWKQSLGKRPDRERMSQQAFSPRHNLYLIPGIVVAIALEHIGSSNAIFGQSVV